MKLNNVLASAMIERQVEDAYNYAVKKAFPEVKIDYPFACDGYCEFKIGETTYRLLIEYKYDEDLQSSTTKAKVLSQVLFYLKRFEQNGRIPPNVCMVADKNECFVMHTNPLLKYLDFENIDWSKAPSSAGSNGDLVLALSEDEDINPFVFDVDSSFDFDTVAQKLRDLASGTVRLVHVTEHNVDKVFKGFSEKIVLEKKFSPNVMVALFFAVVTGSEDVYLHPTKNNTLVYNGKNIRCDSSKFKAFCKHFSTTCSPKEKARLAAISDRLIEDTKRRLQGAFFTPTEWCDYSHLAISNWLGKDWKDEYVVVDPAAGTLNLERDYNFKELYASTLEQSELDIAKNYNTNSCKFVFDFLNGSDEELFDKAPGIKNALEKHKKIVVFFNPPYATAGAYDIRQTSNHQTLVKKMMENDSIQASELYAQFLYRIMKLQEKYNANIKIALFSKITFLAAGKFKKFRKKFFKQFKFDRGFIFNAGHFQGTSDSWPIAFSMFSLGQQLSSDFKYSVVESNDDGDLVIVGEKTIWNLDDANIVSLKKWLGKEKKDTKFPISAGFGMQSFYKQYTGRTPIDKLLACKDCIGVLGRSTHHEFLMQTAFGGDIIDFLITKKNIFKTSILFSVYHFLSQENYLHDKDIPLAPILDTESKKKMMSEFALDSFVFMLLNGYDIGLRDIELNGTYWNEVKNEFFFMSKNDIENLANEYGFDEMYNDAHISSERFAYEKLKDVQLSYEARACFEKTKKLIINSFKYRHLFDEEHPEYQLSRTWDAGWYQVKQMLKEYMPDELKEFKELYKKLADKMRPMIYELGFLRK